MRCSAQRRVTQRLRPRCTKGGQCFSISAKLQSPNGGFNWSLRRAGCSHRNRLRRLFALCILSCTSV